MAGTRWVKLDVSYFRNPKAVAARRDGRALHLASICYSGDLLTDGVLSDGAVKMLLSDADVKRSAIDLVVDAGLWIPAGSGFVVHDFTAMQDSRARVEAKRRVTAERVAKWRARQARLDLDGDEM